MSDQDSPAFQVVDRRTKLQDGSIATEEGLPGTAAAIEETDVLTPDSNLDSVTETDFQEGTDEAESGEHSLPDPGFLLTMATLQMDARGLVQALIPIFDGYAWRSMGFLADPKTGETNKDMAAAQLAIDSVQFLLSKVEAQMPESERRDMQRRLSDLRMNYITKLREP